MAADSVSALAMEAFVAHLPRGLPPGAQQRSGQLDLSRAMCHDERAQRRLNGVRAEPDPLDAGERVALEMFLVGRAAGMVPATPAVRP